MGLLSGLFNSTPETDFKTLVKNGALIIDVRTPAEYETGHIPGSVNIELSSINFSLNDIKKKNKTIIAVCRSGSRSGMAVTVLTAAGIQAYNGGPWDSLQQMIA